MLVALDGFDERVEVIVLAATNRSDALDPALLRPGRFDRQVVVEAALTGNGREQILKVHTRGKPIDRDVDLSLIARSTPGFSADLANLVNEAAPADGPGEGWVSITRVELPGRSRQNRPGCRASPPGVRSGPAGGRLP